MVVVLLLIVAVLATSAALSIFGKGTSLPYRVANVIVSPFQKLFASVKNTVDSKWISPEDYDALKAENESLRAELQELRKLSDDASFYRAENIQLRALLDMRESYVDLNIDVATVVAWGDPGWSASFTLNKGERDGLHLNDCVITKDGLVGIVSRLEGGFAEVNTLIDSQFNVGVYLPRTGIYGVAGGSYDAMKRGVLTVELLPLNADVHINDRVITSGASDLFPPEIEIGTVTDVYTAADGMSLCAEVTPLVDVRELTQVFVVLGYEMVEVPAGR